ncbi:unnamed protein product [Parajaminaea phylloscopi]
MIWTSLVASLALPMVASALPQGRANTWQPNAGAQWNIQLLKPLTASQVGSYPIWDIDLYDNTAATIASAKAKGTKVICYFSAGSYENWRPDAKNWTKADYGKGLDGWDGEWWSNTKSSNVRDIMRKRLQLAASKGCDGVDPDNIDAYNNDNGLGLTQADAIDYVQFLATEAKALGLSIGLKNSAEIIPSVLSSMQWSVNEQCAQYNECEPYAAFIKAGKPVFHIEYPKGDKTNNNKAVTGSKATKACTAKGADNFSTLIKNINLDGWTQTCSGQKKTGQTGQKSQKSQKQKKAVQKKTKASKKHRKTT